MRALQWVAMKWRAIFHRADVEREMEAELAEHLEHDPSMAVRLDVIREEIRDARGLVAYEQLKQDVGFGLRLLRKKRTFSIVALGTMALAIGSTTAVYSLIDWVLVRPLPFAAPAQLFYAEDIGMRGPSEVLRGNSKLVDYASHMGARAFTLTERTGPERVEGSETSANFFQVLGVNPEQGRTFVEGEDRPTATRVIVLSHAFWMQKFAGRADAIGRHMTLDERDYEVTGVMPATFQYPARASFWVPLRLDPRAVGDYWGSGGLDIIARLRPGATPEAADAELRAWMPRIRGMFPWRMPDAWGSSARLTPLRDHMVAASRVRSLLLLGAVGFVLLIAVVNVANLMIGQAAARQREFTMRAALGGTPARLVRQVLTEAVVLAVIGGCIGAALAFAQLALLKRLLPADTPRLAEVVIDARVLLFTVAISLASGVLFGLLPACRVRSRRLVSSTRVVRTDALLVMTEAAFSTVLLVGAGLLLHSLWTVLQVDPGFRVAQVVTAELAPNRSVAASLDKSVATYEDVRAKLASFPGVTSVGAIDMLPLTPSMSGVASTIEDHPVPEREPQYVLWTTVITPTLVDALGMRVLQGRGFSSVDQATSDSVVLISKSTARRFWPDRSPIGRRLRPIYMKQWRTIIGVVDDVKAYSITGPPAFANGEVYIPLTQALSAPKTLSIVAQVSGDPGDFEKHLPAMIQEACAQCAVSKVARMETVVAKATDAPRSLAWLVGGLALLALSLAGVGIYGVVNHSVVRRTRELGVRLALGARPANVAWLVMSASLRYTVAGAIAGVAISWAMSQSVNSLLYDVSTHDAASFSIAPVTIVAVALVASVVPMMRAARIDPAKSLREG